MRQQVQVDEQPPRRLWPWLLAALVGLGVVLAVLWVRAEVRRIGEQREPPIPLSGATNR